MASTLATARPSSIMTSTVDPDALPSAMTVACGTASRLKMGSWPVMDRTPCGGDMGKDDAHGAAVQHPLHEAVAALVRDADEWGQAGVEAGVTEDAGVGDAEVGVLKVDEEAVVAGVLDDRGYGRVGHGFDAKGLFGGSVFC
ncbi:uncharacterized protein PgNI_01236 [Pyricularia grisea]|uniref:Uncharacterized protein n=1 Tax=Pyricularia grisea TaxID=148305 RepID=A0A6P8BHS7_PYRGI|nr:uncharacterized protein PgNI_01236 [Pyricularia grisea]TLD16328.1 hypothetical protein PgNI_01236 [Pyricularia grisea]